MIRPAAFLLLAALAAVPAAAESIYIEDTSDWTAASATDYELVDETDRIVMARAVARLGGEARFKIEERLKGDAGEAAFLDTQSDAAKGSLHLLFMDESDGEWLLSSVGIVEVEAENRDWVRAIRLFARISALDDAEAEKQALRDLREAALADPGRYPEALVRMIDLHFGTPSLGKTFSELVDMYDSAPTDGERLAVLRALSDAGHPETGDFFRGLLLGGQPLWLMQPVIEWMQERSEEDLPLPLLKDLARVWLGHAGENRGELLDLMLQIAEPEDSPLLWGLMPAADLAEKAMLVDHVLGGKGPNPFADGLRLRPDDPVTADLFALWFSDEAASEAKVRLEAILRRNDTGDWGAAASLEELLSAWEASREPAARREILMEVVRRLEGPDSGQGLPALWRLLRQASGREVEDLVRVVYTSLWEDEKDLAALYRAASGEEEKNRALWVILAQAGAHELEPLLSAAGALGRGPHRLERVARAFVTCPVGEARLEVTEQIIEELALPGDFLAMLQILEGASLAEARVLAPWFARHPGPEVLPLLWRVPVDSLYVEPELTEALAASGDPEVLDMALDLRRRVATEDYRWPFHVIAWSPLPAAEEEARSILQNDDFPSFQLMRELGSEGNPSPWRERFLQEIAEIETLDEALREHAITYLARLSSPGAEPEP